MNPERSVTIRSGALALEGKLREGDGRLAVVVMHPHPQYGGDMNNHVVVALGDALAATGATTLRFNSRGTGRSEGVFEGGPGEAEDARAAIRNVKESAADAKVVLAGYSFGAMIAAAVAQDADLDGLVLISPPVGMTQLPPLPEGLPVLVVTGDQDSISPAVNVRELAGPNVDVMVVPDADHGWWPGIDDVAAAMVAFVKKVAYTST